MIRLFVFLGILLVLVATAESYICRRVVAFSLRRKMGQGLHEGIFSILTAVPLIIGLQ